MESLIINSKGQNQTHAVYNHSSNLSNTLWPTLPNFKILGKIKTIRSEFTIYMKMVTKAYEYMKIINPKLNNKTKREIR